MVVSAETFKWAIDVLRRQAETSRVILYELLKVPCTGINRVRKVGDKTRIVVEIVRVVIDHAIFPIGLVIGAPRQLNISATIIELSICGHCSRVPITSLIVILGTIRRSNGGKFLIVLIATRFPNGMSHNCNLTVERIARRDAIDGIYKSLCGLCVVTLKRVVFAETSLEISNR